MDVFFETKNRFLTWEEVRFVSSALSEKSNDAELAASGIYRIADSAKPVPGQYQAVRQLLPIKVNGKYTRRYEVYNMFTADYYDPALRETITVAQQKANYDARLLTEAKNNVSEMRELLLAQFVIPYSSDVLVWENLSPSQQQSIRSYRAALFAVEQQPGYPSNVVWPAPPSL
jgi:hypothetical protein